MNSSPPPADCASAQLKNHYPPQKAVGSALIPPAPVPLPAGGFRQQPVVAVHDAGLFVRVEVHSVSHAVLPLAAVPARAAFRPAAVAYIAEAVLPHVHKTVAADVPLNEVGAADAQAAADRAVAHDGGDGNARAAEEEMVADFQLPRAEAAFARIVQPDAPAVRRAVGARLRDEFHKPNIFRAAQRKAFAARPSLRINRENPPRRNAKLNEKSAQLWKRLKVSRMDAGDYVEQKASGIAPHEVCGDADSGNGSRKRLQIPPQEGMLRLQSVKVEAHARHSCRHKALEPPPGERKSVRNDSPRPAASHNLRSRPLDVVPEERLTARNADSKPGNAARLDVVQNAHKFRKRHIRDAGRLQAVASAVAAAHVAFQRAFPEQVAERVMLDLGISVPPEHLAAESSEEHIQPSESARSSSASTLKLPEPLSVNSFVSVFFLYEPFSSPSMSSKMYVRYAGITSASVSISI